MPDFIANQIAAGEVVQRPESVVKELVENSLDAGADEIAVLIKDAGKQLIHIIDNGSGLSQDDLQLSIKRHATSKIFSQEQLESIITYGFRGEALASIASVAKLEIRTKQKNDKLGLQLLSEPGKPPVIEPFNTNDGTQIFVRSLFYNTPARRKFLRSNITEFRHISETMIKFAIAHTNKRFTFYDDDNIIFDVKPEPLQNRLKYLVGNQVIDNLIPVDFEDERIKINGYIGTPELAAKRSYGDYLYLNGRPIKSRSLSHAIFTSFEHLLEKNSKPFFILFLTIDPRDVDINVHPQKHEVKFENERYIYNNFLKAISSALGTHNLFPSEDNAFEITNPFDIVGKDDEKVIVNKMTGEIIYDNTNNENNSSFRSEGRFIKSNDFPISPSEVSAYEKLFGSNSDNDIQIKEKNIQINQIINILRIDNGIYQILLDDLICYIDILHAHRRILYEKALNSENVSIPSQQLLFPFEINEDYKIERINQLNGILNSLGYSYEKDKQSLKLTSVPSIGKSGNEVNAFSMIIDSDELVAEKSNIEKVAQIFAMQNSYKRGDELNDNEIKSLIEQLYDCNNHRFSPSGFKTIYFVEKKSIINHFK